MQILSHTISIILYYKTMYKKGFIMNHKKLLTVALVSALSGIAFASEVTNPNPVVILPFPSEEEVEKDCEFLGNIDICGRYKALRAAREEIIKETGVAPIWTTEEIELCKEIVALKKALEQKLPEETSSILEKAEVDAKEAKQEIAEKLGLEKNQ
jgi:hypothetical protein